MQYLKQGDIQIPVSDYFRKEKDIDECVRKQFAQISSIIYDNYNLIGNFFSSDNYDINMSEFDKFWRNKHPELYKNN
jgi:hypothetical protein